MDLFSNLALGFSTVLSLVPVNVPLIGVVPLPVNILLCFVGCLIGTLIGVLPGVGPIATIAILLPITFGLDPTGALIMLAGIYYGAQYGGSTTAILVNIPGEATSVVTTLDGHAMAKQGRAGVALGIAALGSFFAGCVATLVIAALGLPLTKLAMLFGPAEYFSLMVMGLVFAVVLARGSIVKAIAMIVLGLLLATVGTDLESGEERLTLGPQDLSDGVDFAVLAMGLFGFAEILRNLENPETRDVVNVHRAAAAERWRISSSHSRRSCAARSWARSSASCPATARCWGPLPPTRWRRRSQRIPAASDAAPSRVWQAPRSANNAGAQTAFIPLLTLGIPPNAVMALMVGAMTIHGIIPGPQVMTKNPNLFWGMVVSMWIGNLMLLIINLPLVGLWVRLLKVPYRLMFPAILIFCCIGIYSINNNPSDVLFTAFFGLVGYVLMKFGFEPAPMLLGFVLGKLMEEKLRQALILSRGSFATFVDRPVSAGLLLVAAVLLVVALLPAIQKSRDEVFTE